MAFAEIMRPLHPHPLPLGPPFSSASPRLFLQHSNTELRPTTETRHRQHMPTLSSTHQAMRNTQPKKPSFAKSKYNKCPSRAFVTGPRLPMPPSGLWQLRGPPPLGRCIRSSAAQVARRSCAAPAGHGSQPSVPRLSSGADSRPAPRWR